MFRPSTHQLLAPRYVRVEEARLVMLLSPPWTCAFRGLVEMVVNIRSGRVVGLALALFIALATHVGAQPSQLPGAGASQEIRVRQILVETEAEAKEIAAALKAGGDFVELVKRSKEEGGLQRGGDLGYMLQEDTLPAFWAVAAALEPGQISEPIETEFGWHVIRVEDKRDRTASPPRPPGPTRRR
jgi:hypothetical protein